MRPPRSVLVFVAALAGFTMAGLREGDAAAAPEQAAETDEPTLNTLVKHYSTQEIFCLNVHEERRLRLNNGVERVIRLVSVKEHRDSVIRQMRRAEIGVEIDGKPWELVCEPYEMPTEIAGLRLQADTTSAWVPMPKRVQFSAWDAGDPIADTRRFGFPIRNYRLFSQGTQAFNEAVHLGCGDGDPAGQKFCHDYGMDMAGFERREEIASATDGEIVKFLPSREQLCSVIVQDAQGFLWSYGHLDSVLPEIAVGARVRRGQKLGMLGKTGPSGNFSHLHLGACLSRADLESHRSSRNLNLYPWLVAAYEAEHPKGLYAVARPHRTVLTGETVALDGSKSLAFGSPIVSWRWVFHDGETVTKARAEKVFVRPGTYVATLWVKNEKGAEDVDFCQIRVFSRTSPESAMPTIFMSYTPTEEIRVGQPVLFRLWFQGDNPGRLRLDFGDGTRRDDYVSYAEIGHRFQTPGIQVVTAQCEAGGKPITQKQKVVVGAKPR